MRVSLDLDLCRRSLEAGERRVIANEERGTAQQYGHGARDAEQEADSIGGEIAVAIAIDRKEEIPRILERATELDRGGDVGPGVQARQTKWPNGRLPLHPKDADDHWFFLATGQLPDFVVVGYISGLEGKRVGSWGDLQPDRPCYRVEQRDLTRIRADQLGRPCAVCGRPAPAPDYPYARCLHHDVEAGEVSRIA